MIGYVFIGLFFTATAFNLIGTRKGLEKFAKYSKPFLMSLLCLYCVFKGLPDPNMLLIFALFACWLGDILINPQNTKWFIIGGAAFAIGHVLFICTFAQKIDFSSISFAAVIPVTVVYVAVSALVIYLCRKKAPKFMLLPLLIYLLCNTATSIFALCLVTESFSIWHLISFLGAVLFFVSDCALFLLQFDSGKHKFFETDLFVMSTYISGLFMIAIGLEPLF